MVAVNRLRELSVAEQVPRPSGNRSCGKRCSAFPPAGRSAARRCSKPETSAMRTAARATSQHFAAPNTFDAPAPRSIDWTIAAVSCADPPLPRLPLPGLPAGRVGVKEPAQMRCAVYRPAAAVAAASSSRSSRAAAEAAVRLIACNSWRKPVSCRSTILVGHAIFTSWRKARPGSPSTIASGRCDR